MKMCRRYRGRHPVQKNQSSVGRGHGVVCGPRARHIMETRDKPSLRVVNPPPPSAKQSKSHQSDDSSGLSGSETDDSSSDSSKATSDTESKSISNESSETHSSSSSSSNESDGDSSNSSNSKSKSQPSGLTESELLSDSDTSFSTSEEEDKNFEKIQRQMRRLEMNSNANSQMIQIVDGSKEREATKRNNTKGPQEPTSSVESDPGFARYMSTFHERWKKHGTGPRGPCVHSHRSTIASTLKMAKRETVGKRHGPACNHESVNAAAIFNKRQQILYGDRGTFACDHANKHDRAMMMQAISDDVQSNKMIHDLIEKQVQKVKCGASRTRADLLKNPKC